MMIIMIVIITENKDLKVLWDITVQTDKHLQHNLLHIVIICMCIRARRCAILLMSHDQGMVEWKARNKIILKSTVTW